MTSPRVSRQGFKQPVGLVRLPVDIRNIAKPPCGFHEMAELCPVISYPDPAPLGRVVGVSKTGFKGT